MSFVLCGLKIFMTSDCHSLQLLQEDSRGRSPLTRPFSAGLFGRGNNTTIYPQPNDNDVDVETGVSRNRRKRFSTSLTKRKEPNQCNWTLVSRSFLRHFRFVVGVRDTHSPVLYGILL